MRFLIDTCALVWFLKDERKSMPGKVMGLVEDPDNEMHVSVAAIWEMAIKASLGRLELPRGMGGLAPQRLEENGFELLGIEFCHAAGVLDLPFVHRDPFDRLMISQCREEDLIAITPDAPWADPSYGIETTWG